MKKITLLAIASLLVSGSALAENCGNYGDNGQETLVSNPDGSISFVCPAAAAAVPAEAPATLAEVVLATEVAANATSEVVQVAVKANEAAVVAQETAANAENSAVVVINPTQERVIEQPTTVITVDRERNCNLGFSIEVARYKANPGFGCEWTEVGRTVTQVSSAQADGSQSEAE